MRATLEQIKKIVADYVDAAKQAGTWVASKDNLVGLMDKIAKTVTIDGDFQDKLQVLDGEELSLGKTVEEYYQDLCAIYDYSGDPATTDLAEAAMKPYYPTYEDCTYSYTLGRKVIPTTLKYDEYERACNSSDELVRVTNLVLKRLYDTFNMFKFNSKKQLVANCIDKVFDEIDVATATPFNAGAAIVKGTRYSVGADVYKCTKNATADSLANHIQNGALIKYDLVAKVPTKYDYPEAGEVFVETVKLAAEDASFASEGHCINGGATIGATDGLLLICKKGIQPMIQTETLAGAFNPENLAMPAEIVVVDNLPCKDQDVVGVIIDRRGLRLHPTYFSVKENLNGFGDYMNYFLHTENTAFISKNTFVRVLKQDASVNP